MQLFNCHTHTSYSPDGKADLLDICEEALSDGLSGFAVTDHLNCEEHGASVNFSNIKKSFVKTNSAKKEYCGKLIIASGVEIGDPIFCPAIAEKAAQTLSFDVLLASVHTLFMHGDLFRLFRIDFSEYTEEQLDAVMLQYFHDINKMLNSIDFDILCHLTLPLRYIEKRCKRKVQLERYESAISDVLKALIRLDRALEINSSGFSEGDRFFMPDENIINMYIALGGTKFTLGSDSHINGRLSRGLEAAAELLLSRGITELYYYINRKPIKYSIK